MMELILAILLILMVSICGIKLGIDCIVTELRSSNRINQDEAEYMHSWQYLLDKLREA